MVATRTQAHLVDAHVVPLVEGTDESWTAGTCAPAVQPVRLSPWSGRPPGASPPWREQVYVNTYMYVHGPCGLRPPSRAGSLVSSKAKALQPAQITILLTCGNLLDRR